MSLLLCSYKTVLFSAVLVMTFVLSWYTTNNNNNNYYHFFTPVYAKIARFRGGINVNDPNLKAEVVASRLRFPTTMAFLGPNDILVNEKNNGKVQRIIDGKIQSQPLLDVSVANKVERGMIGIAVAKPNSTSNATASTTTNNNNNGNNSSHTYVFVSYTETKVEGSDICPKPSYCEPGHDPLGNRLYRYELVNNKLVNPKLLLDVAAVPGPGHNGQKILIGPDNNIYITVGDVGYKSQTENFANNPDTNGTGGILRITQDGKPVGTGIIGDKFPLNLYYAYGIRNSLGIDFDPVTGNLWDTENGDNCCDEINLVKPGFNSGWRQVQGFWEVNGTTYGKLVQNPTTLVNFGGKGKYSPPKFTWLNTSGPTAIKFLDSDKLGKQYQNDMFVADYHGGNIYHFKLNQNRTQFVLNGTLADKIANNAQELERIKFAEGMGAITDLQVSPYDGYLYAVSYSQGKIYRIGPETK